MELEELGTSHEDGAEAIYRVWPGAAPGSEGWDWQERTVQIPWTARARRYTRNVVVPTLTHFPPAPGTGNGTAMIIAPGGAFHFLMIEHEGHDMARWLAQQGVTAFVLTYRLARTPDDDAEVLDFRAALHKRLGGSQRDQSTPPDRPDMRDIRAMGEEDGRQAMRLVRTHAGRWQIDPARIGIAGFSAGGGVSLGAAMQFDADSRPDFAVGVYPAWPAQLDVPPQAPPLFLVMSDDDPQVAPLSASRLYEAWHKAGSPAELHVFGNGGHGYGMSPDGWLSDIWPELLRRWMAERGLLPKTR